MGTLAFIPAASGLAGVLFGPSTLPGGESDITATLDGEYRFTNTFWLATAPLIWSQLPEVGSDSPTLPLVMATVFTGGLARVLAWRRSGRPHPVFLPAIALELVGMPALAAWRRRIKHRLPS
jgi:Domain of unknown function (DUF4345)